MKAFRKIIILLLCTLIFTLSIPFSAVAEEKESRFGREILSGMDNSAALVSCYDEIKEGCENLNSKITLSKDITLEELRTIIVAFTNDFPEIFWFTGGYSYSQAEDSDYISFIEPEYLFHRSKTAAAKASLEAMSEKLIEGLENKSDYEKALVIHDRLAKRVVYTQTDKDQTAYGAIVEGQAVCAGYARAYHYLLNKVGITAWSIQGESISPTSGDWESHRWNMAKLDGKWYYTDVTWDDQESTLYHTYFNRPYSYFSETHFPTKFGEYLPMEDNTSLDYFKKNNLIFTSVDTDRIIKLLKKSDNLINLYVDGNVDTFIKNLGNKMATIVRGLGAQGGASYTYTTVKLGNEVFLQVVIEPAGHTHSLKKVSGSPATCYQTGTADYYKCSCGKMFADSKGKQKISINEIAAVDKLPHTEADSWQFDEKAHWKNCSVCGADIDTTSALHIDDNEDKKCDVCSAEIKEEPQAKVEKTDTYTSFPPYIIGIAAAAILILFIILKVKRR